MTTRTSEKTVTFARPFFLGEFDDALPAGAYVVETVEELLEGISFRAYRRTLTLLHHRPESGRGGLVETFTVEPAELEAALERDRAGGDGSSAPPHRETIC